MKSRKWKFCKSKLNHILQNEQKGYTMIFVLCILALFVALSLTVLFSSGKLIQSAGRALDKEQCRLSVNTYVQLLETQLKKKDSSVCVYLNEKMEDNAWNDNDSAKLEVNISNGSDDFAEELGKLTLEMYLKEGDLMITVKCERGGEIYLLSSKYGRNGDSQPIWELKERL